MNIAGNSDVPPLEGGERFLASAGVLLASFMNVLDTTIAVVALPAISGGLGATPSQGSWVLTIYSVCLAVVLPLAGWISRRFGQIRSFYIAVFVFTLTSWLCASASSFNELLIFRALQGMSGGLLIPYSQSIILRIYPVEEHGKALGLWGLTSAVGPVAGPILGGLITDHLGWPWIFYINIPIGLFCVWACVTFMRRYETPIKRVPVDVIGLLLLVVGIISLQLMLDRGHELDWFASRQVWVLAGVGTLCLVFFFIWELDEEHPVVDLSLFAGFSFTIGAVMTALFYGVFIVVAVMYPLWMQTVMGYTPGAAGMVMAMTTLFPILTMPLLGQRARNWDPRLAIFAGIALMIVIVMLHGSLTVQVSSTYLTVVRFMIGLSMPFVWTPLMMITFSNIAAHKMDDATGLYNFLRMLASSMATALGITLWDDRTIVHRADLVARMSESSIERTEFLTQATAATGDVDAALVMAENIIFQQARTMAQQDVFLAACAVLVVVALLALTLSRARLAPAPAPDQGAGND